MPRYRIASLRGVRHVPADRARRDGVRARRRRPHEVFRARRTARSIEVAARRRRRAHRRRGRRARMSSPIEGTPVRMVTIGDEVHRVVVRPGATRGAYTLWLDGYASTSRRSTNARAPFASCPAPRPGRRARRRSSRRCRGSSCASTRRSATTCRRAGARRDGGDEDGERAARARPPGRVKAILVTPAPRSRRAPC